MYDTGFLIPIAHATLLGPEVNRISLLTMYGNTTMKDTQLVVVGGGGDATAKDKGKHIVLSGI